MPRSPNCHIETPRVLGKFDVVRCKVKLCGIADVRSGLRLGHAVTGAPPSFDTHLYLCQYRHVPGHAYRAVYAVSTGDAIYVVHAFQKKSKAGIATAKSDVELVRQRLKQLRNEVKNAEKKSP